MAMEILPKESKGDDTQFECHVGSEIWIVSLHFDAALIASKSSPFVYFSRGGEHHIGWWRRRRENIGKDWEPVIDPALIDLLDSLHFTCLRKDETESAVPQSGRAQAQVEDDPPVTQDDTPDKVKPRAGVRGRS